MVRDGKKMVFLPCERFSFCGEFSSWSGAKPAAYRATFSLGVCAGSKEKGGGGGGGAGVGGGGGGVGGGGVGWVVWELSRGKGVWK